MLLRRWPYLTKYRTRAGHRARRAHYGRQAAYRARWGSGYAPRGRYRGRQRTGGYYGRYNRTRRNPTPELKFHDIATIDAVIASGGVITSGLITIPQGTTENERIGRKLTIRKIGMKIRINLAEQTSDGSTEDTVRLMLILDKQCNGAAPAILDILETADFQSFNNLSNSFRFRTLMDRTFSINAQSGAGNGTAQEFGQNVINTSFYKDCFLPIEYSGVTGAITEIRSNHIILLSITHGNVAGLEIQFRFRFSDN